MKVERDVIFTKDGNVYTSAGISTGIDLALAFVEEDQGRAAALAMAKWLVLYVRRTGGQVQLSRLLEAQATWTGRFDRLQEWILEHLPEELSVEKLAAAAGMSPRHFARVFRSEKRVTPARFVERLRVEAAGRMLSESEAGLKEVAAACGFGSADSMARSFARVTGLAPREYARSQQPGLQQREQSKRTPTRRSALSVRVPRRPRARSRDTEPDVEQPSVRCRRLLRILVAKEPHMKALDVVTGILVTVGALNWGLIGTAQFNLVAALFGQSALASLVYILVGIAAVYQAFRMVTTREPVLAHA